MFKTRRKKWQELTTEEKVEWLKREEEYPSFVYVLILLGMFIMVMVTFLAVMDSYRVTDLYNQTHITMSNETQQTVDQMISSKGQLLNMGSYLLIGIIVLHIIQFSWWMWKWRKFNKSIRVKRT